MQHKREIHAESRLHLALIRMQDLPLSLRTFNLHMAICRLFEQEAARGPAAKDQETWVERVVQNVKENLKFRISSCPERLYVSDRLVDDALARWGREPGMQTFDAWDPAYR
jgi:hypothetical protein